LTTKAEVERGKAVLESMLFQIEAQLSYLKVSEQRLRQLQSSPETWTIQQSVALKDNIDAQQILIREIGRTANQIDTANNRLQEFESQVDNTTNTTNTLNDTLSETVDTLDDLGRQRSALTYIQRLEREFLSLVEQIDDLNSTPFVERQQLQNSINVLRQYRDFVEENNGIMLYSFQQTARLSANAMLLSVQETAARIQNEVDKLAIRAKNLSDQQERKIASLQNALNEFQQFVNATFSSVDGIFIGLFNRRIQQIDELESAELRALDSQLNNARLTEQQREQLLQKRDAAERKFALQRAKETRELAIQQRKLGVLQVVINTAIAVTKATTPWGKVAAATEGALQLASILAQPLPVIPAFNKGGIVGGKVGADKDTVLAALTTGEAVINRASTAANLPLINAMNQYKGVDLTGITKYGGMNMPTSAVNNNEINELRKDVRTMTDALLSLELTADMESLRVGMDKHNARISQVRTIR